MVVHRDLKLENMLLTGIDPAAADAKLADFGLCKLVKVSSCACSCHAEQPLGLLAKLLMLLARHQMLLARVPDLLVSMCVASRPHSLYTLLDIAHQRTLLQAECLCSLTSQLLIALAVQRGMIDDPKP